MKRWNKVAVLGLIGVLVTVAGCGGGGTVKNPDARNVDTPITPVVTAGPGKGLSASDQQQFYHLAEGSEIFPLSWMRALVSTQTGRPFTENLQRFGLLADPANEDDLPVGLTAATSRDTRFLGIKMVGVNCAACHVNEMKVGDKTVRIDGAPNLFDLGGFYGDLLGSAKDTATSATKLFAFLRTLAEQPENNTLTIAGASAAQARVSRSFASLDEMRAAGDLEKQAVTELEAIIKQENDKPSEDLATGLSVKAQKNTATSQAASLEGAKVYAEKLKDKKMGEKSPLAKLGSQSVVAESILPGWLQQAGVVLKLLRSRADFLLKLATMPSSVKSGSGRIDAFGGARNLIFGSKFAQPTSGPVNYPHLWGFADTVWLHWDANTTSVIERNIGQALGLGAVYNPNSFESTVQVRNLHLLEVLAAKIAAPKWPEDVFGKIDTTKAQRGKALFQKKCSECHVGPGQPDPDKEALLALNLIGTDPARAVNFASNLGDQPFVKALADALTKIKTQAYADAKVSAAEAKEIDGARGSNWRAPGSYARRPLPAVWATAPYLHNGSVPTLYDLLLPPDQRPKNFPLGQRDYDTKKLGYTTSVPGQAIFTFDATLDGNRNSGHNYGTDLSDDERWDLLEFLKSN